MGQVESQQAADAHYSPFSPPPSLSTTNTATSSADHQVRAHSPSEPSRVSSPKPGQATTTSPTNVRFKRKSTSDAGMDTGNSPSTYSNLAGRAARVPLSWASQGAELVAHTTVNVAVTTLNVALKTTSVFASTTETAANIAAQNLTSVSLKTASVATQTASLITLATSASVKTAGEAIGGAANLVVEGFSPAQDHRASSPPPATTAAAAAALHMSPSSARPASRSHDSVQHDVLLLPEAMVALGANPHASHETLNKTETPPVVRNLVGNRFWGMLGSTNESARRHWVTTVTSTKATPPSTKYFRKICILAYETKGQSVDEFYKMLHGRPLATSSICALKALTTCLRLVREGPPEALDFSIANVHIVDSVGAFYAEKIFLERTVVAAAAASEVLNEHMLIARLSGFIVQKMHFHSLQRGNAARMNARYEMDESVDMTKSRVEEDADDDDEFERLVQLASSLLTLLGTIEGVTRLALAASSPSPMALLLATLLIEESLGAFDCLSTTLAGIKARQREQDAALIKSLSTRYQNAYEAIRLYCLRALQFPYVVALNKVPILSKDRLAIVERPPLPTSSALAAATSASAQSFSPWLLFGYANNAPPATAAASAPAAPPAASLAPPSTNLLLLRPLTRMSILEGLEEEEKLMDSLIVSSASHKGFTTQQHQQLSAMSAAGSGGSEPHFFSPNTSAQSLLNEESWDLYCSIENAKPPIEFEAEDDDFPGEEEQGKYTVREEDDGASSLHTDVSPYAQEQLQVRTATQGNPFDTGNSSVLLLAMTHRSAFSGITNPFASGQFTTNNNQQQLSLFNVFPSTTGPSNGGARKEEGDETSRALEQCAKLFEFTGIHLPAEEVDLSSEIIGRGAFSVVFRGKLASTGEDVAVKELSIEEWGTTPRVILDFRAEVSLMKAVHHPNVLRLIGACTSPKLRLISEYCHRGNLFDFLYYDRAGSGGSTSAHSRVLTWPLRLRLALGEARGMHFLHTAFPVPLIHRDLKSLNLLLSKTFQLKVSDFGLSRFRSKKKSEAAQTATTAATRSGEPCGTTHWMAPEVIEGEEYDEKADIYSFGINLWELCTRRIPWEGERDVKRLVVAGHRLALTEDALDANCPPALVDLIQRCWQKDAKLRPDFGTICKELKRISNIMEDREKGRSDVSD